MHYILNVVVVAWCYFLETLLPNLYCGLKQSHGQTHTPYKYDIWWTPTQGRRCSWGRLLASPLLGTTWWSTYTWTRRIRRPDESWGPTRTLLRPTRYSYWQMYSIDAWTEGQLLSPVLCDCSDLSKTPKKLGIRKWVRKKNSPVCAAWILEYKS